MSLNKQFKIEYEISKLIFDDNGSSAHFDHAYDPYGSGGTCSIYTLNPRHGTHFLLMAKSSDDDKWKIKLLNEMLEQLKKSIKPSGMYPYEVTWTGPKNMTVVSHFYGHSAKDVLDKFYSGKNEHDYKVLNLKLLPDA